jgi:hypothetical protein
MTHQRVPAIDNEGAARHSPNLEIAMAETSKDLADSKINQQL